MGTRFSSNNDYNRVLAAQEPTSISIPRFEPSSSSPQARDETLSIPVPVRYSLKTKNEPPVVSEQISSTQSSIEANPLSAPGKTDTSLVIKNQQQPQIVAQNTIRSNIPINYQKMANSAFVLSRSIINPTDRRYANHFSSTIRPFHSIVERNGKQYLIEFEERIERRYVQCMDETANRMRFFEVIDRIPCRIIQPHYQNSHSPFDNGKFEYTLQSDQRSVLPSTYRNRPFQPSSSEWIKNRLPLQSSSSANHASQFNRQTNPPSTLSEQLTRSDTSSSISRSERTQTSTGSRASNSRQISSTIPPAPPPPPPHFNSKASQKPTPFESKQFSAIPLPPTPPPHPDFNPKAFQKPAPSESKQSPATPPPPPPPPDFNSKQFQKSTPSGSRQIPAVPPPPPPPPPPLPPLPDFNSKQFQKSTPSGSRQIPTISLPPTPPPHPDFNPKAFQKPTPFESKQSPATPPLPPPLPDFNSKQFQKSTPSGSKESPAIPLPPPPPLPDFNSKQFQKPTPSGSRQIPAKPPPPPPLPPSAPNTQFNSRNIRSNSYQDHKPNIPNEYTRSGNQDSAFSDRSNSRQVRPASSTSKPSFRTHTPTISEGRSSISHISHDREEDDEMKENTNVPRMSNLKKPSSLDSRRNTMDTDGTVDGANSPTTIDPFARPKNAGDQHLYRRRSLARAYDEPIVNRRILRHRNFTDYAPLPSSIQKPKTNEYSRRSDVRKSEYDYS